MRYQFSSYQGLNPTLVVSDPELIRQITVKDFNVFPNRRAISSGLDDITEKFLSRSKGDDWKRMRTIITPTFTSGKMRRMFLSMNETAQEAVDALAEYTETGVEVDLKPYASRFTLDVIARCCFAVRPNSHKNPENPFFKASSNIFKFGSKYKLMALLMLPNVVLKLLQMKLFPQEPIEYYKKAILSLIKERREKNIVVDDFLQLLIEASQETKDNEDETNELDAESHHLNERGEDAQKMKMLFDKKALKRKTLDEVEIIANSVLFLVAGYETTAALITFTLYRLAYDQSVQDKLREALKKSDTLSYEFISTCEYLDAVIQESLRIYPPAVAIDREAVEDYDLIGTNVMIEKGTQVLVPVYALHHSEQFYPEPEKFNPDRFLPENRDQLTPYTYLPFGAGPRNCVGMRFALLEAKLLIAKLILTYNFNHTDKTDYPPKFTGGIGLMQTAPLHIAVHKL